MKKIKLLVLGLCVCSLVGCGKKNEDTETTTDYELATQNTWETTEETTEDVSTESTSSSNTSANDTSTGDTTEEDITTEDSIKKIQYNATGDDLYEKEKDSITNQDEKTNTSVILVDGHKLVLPCTFSDIENTFGTVYVSDGPINTPAKDIDRTFTQKWASVVPSNGEGDIMFRFTSDEPAKITDCMCTGVDLTAIDFEENKLFSFSMKNNIHFGSTMDEIIDTYGKVHDESRHTQDYKNGSFYLKYGGYSDSSYSLEFYGLNDGLYRVVLTRN